MRKRLILAAVTAGSAIAGRRLAGRYRRDRDAANARLAAVARTVMATPFGAVEYAERGAGEPVLAIHGIFGGCDAGLLSVGDLFPDSRVIAPSRFGYLGSSLPPGATPADQADAFAALLDGLGIVRTDVVAVSAGTTSALQLALRHPARVKHLVVISGSWPGSRTAATQSQANRLLVGSDLPMWTLATFARPALIRLIGVPKRLPLTEADGHFVNAVADSIFPVPPRADGVTFDFFVSNPDVVNCDLSGITAPTLIVHAVDDPLASFEAAERAAGRIPGARFLSVNRGGHLMLGQQPAVGPQLAAFLGRPALARTAAAPASGLGNI